MGKTKAVSTYQKGKKGEAKAAAYLRLKGYKVLQENYRVGQGEIDLVVQRNGVLVFVEVKSRRGKASGKPPGSGVAPQSEAFIERGGFLLGLPPESPKNCRFDVVTLGPDKNWLGLPKVRHFENAFSADGNYNV